jgi:hypothetical protein
MIVVDWCASEGVVGTEALEYLIVSDGWPDLVSDAG